MTNNLKAYKVQVPVGSMLTSSGTWTIKSNSGIPYLDKAVSDTATKVVIPIPAPSADGEQGLKLKSIEIPIRVATEDLDSAPIVTLYRRNMLAVAGASADLTASAVTCTTTGATVTADANDRLLTIEVDDPALDYSTEDKATYTAELYINGKDSSAVRVYDAIAYYEVCV